MESLVDLRTAKVGVVVCDSHVVGMLHEFEDRLLVCIAVDDLVVRCCLEGKRVFLATDLTTEAGVWVASKHGELSEDKRSEAFAVKQWIA